MAAAWLGALAPYASGDQRVSHFKGPRYGASDGAPLGLGRFQCRFRRELGNPETASFYTGYWSPLVADALMAQWLYSSGLKERLQAPPAARPPCTTTTTGPTPL